MRQSQFTRWLHLILLVGLVAVPFAGAEQPAVAQNDAPTNTYTWREMGVLMHYPTSWNQTNYAGLPMFVTDPAGVGAAEQGTASNVPALGLLYYPQARDLKAQDFARTLFPEIAQTSTQFLGIDSFTVDYVDEETNQNVHAVAFESPITRVPGIILGVTPVGEWDSFAPEFSTVLNSLEFLGTSADLSFTNGEVELRAPSSWAVAENGQVLALAPELNDAEAVVRGELDGSPGFIRAQIIVPTGIGVDSASPTAAQEVLEQFVGEELSNPINFMWAEEMPAMVAEFEFGELTLLMVVVIDGDTALLIGGGAPVSNWETYQAWVFGALNMTVFNEQPAPANLDAILRGEVDAGDGVFGMTLK